MQDYGCVITVGVAWQWERHDYGCVITVGVAWQWARHDYGCVITVGWHGSGRSMTKPKKNPQRLSHRREGRGEREGRRGRGKERKREGEEKGRRRACHQH